MKGELKVNTAKRAMNKILEGNDVRTVMEAESEWDFSEFIKGSDKKGNPLDDAKAVVQNFFKEKHFLDGLVKGYRVEPVQGVEGQFKVTIQFVPGQTLEGWLADNLIAGMANKFHWSGNKNCSVGNRKGDQMEILCKGDVTW